MRQVWKGVVITLFFMAYMYGVYLFGLDVKAHAAARRQTIGSVK